MSRQSSAGFVSYDLRPAKQCERKMMLDSFGIAMECGLAVSEFRYVGMGGCKFYDFLLMHKFLGLNKMVSLEHDDVMVARARYSCPYRFIEVFEGGVGDFLLGDNYEGNSIYWLDFDGGLTPGLLAELTAVAGCVTVGDFLFVTVNATVPRYMRGFASKKRLAEVNEQFGSLAKRLEQHDVSNQGFVEGIHKLLDGELRNSFGLRRDGEFVPYFQVEYADGQRMLTYGGVFGEVRYCREFSAKLQERMTILSAKSLVRYRIRKFELTERERGLFDRAVTVGDVSSRETRVLAKLGFGKEEIGSYRELLRYYPRYVETLL